MMLFYINPKILQLSRLALFCLGQSSFANEPTLADWQKSIPPNYTQFQKVYGDELKDTVFAQRLRPSHQQKFSDTALTSDKIQLGADLSDKAYQHCLVWGYHRLTMTFGHDDLDKMTDDILKLCQDHQDVYDIYNILLAADKFGVPITEKKAWQRVTESRAKGTHDNRDFHNAVKERVYQLKNDVE